MSRIRLILAAFTLFLSSAAFADHAITVTIDGSTYTCSAGGGNSCAAADVDALIEALNRCRQSNYGASDCIRMTIPSADSIRGCPTFRNKCTQYCVDGNYGYSDCSRMCGPTH